MKTETLMIIGILAIFIVFCLAKFTTKEGFSSSQSLNCYLKNIEGNATGAEGSISSGGRVTGVDIITGINFGNTNGGIATIGFNGGQTELDFYVGQGYNFVQPFPHFPIFNDNVNIKLNGKPVMGGVHGYKLTESQKNDINNQQWNYYFGSNNLIMKNGMMGINMKNPHCINLDASANIGGCAPSC